jgi:hypothetical protein
MNLPSTFTTKKRKKKRRDSFWVVCVGSKLSSSTSLMSITTSTSAIANGTATATPTIRPVLDDDDPPSLVDRPNSTPRPTLGS